MSWCDFETIVRLIAKTSTAKGLTVRCRLDRRRSPVDRRVSDDEIATVNLMPQAYHGGLELRDPPAPYPYVELV